MCAWGARGWGEQDAVNMVEATMDAEEAAKFLAEEAYRRGSADNITCVVVRFHQKPAQE